MCSSSDSTALFVVADAIGGCPIVIKNVTSHNSEHQIVTFTDKEYKMKNCAAAYSPIDCAALMITRSGTLKLVNLRPAPRFWHVLQMGSEQLDVSERQWRFCSLRMSMDGHRGLALDKRGNLLVTDFFIADTSESN